MAVHLDMNLDGVSEAAAALKKMKVDVLQVIHPAFVRGAARGEAEVKAYPPPPAPGEWARNTSKKQKAAFFASLGKGGAKPGGHYIRTGLLGRKWNTRLYSTKTETGARIGIELTYARYVQFDEEQAKFHRGRWTTEVQALENISDDLIDDVKALMITKLNSLYGAGTP